jgi:hypothetical protein
MKQYHCAVTPRAVLRLLLLFSLARGAAAIEFRRGDANLDERVDLADAVFLLEYLFGAGPAPACEDAADCNDDGALDLADAVACLRSLFGERQVPLPYPGEHRPGYDDRASDAFPCGDPPPELVLDEDELFARLTSTDWVRIVGVPGFQTWYTYSFDARGRYSWYSFSDIPHERETGEWNFAKRSDGGGILLLSAGRCQRFALLVDGTLYLGGPWSFQRLGPNEDCPDCRRQDLPPVDPGC